jgi:hypothetical protein
MKLPRTLPASITVALASLVVTAGAAGAQTPVDPAVAPVENDGGWVYWLAIALAALGVVIVIFLIIQYMRYAPRFAKDEEGLKVVRADRVRVGHELPRRNVDLSQAAPIVVAPPAVPAPAAALTSAAPQSGAAAAAPAPAAQAPAPPAAEAPAPPAGQAPAAEAPAAEAPPAQPAVAPAAAPVPEDRPEVTMDQEAYEAALQELLDAGTDRRIAEGRARRAGMIAARKKATGEA